MHSLPPKLAGQLTAVLTFISYPKLLCNEDDALFSVPSILESSLLDKFRFYITSECTLAEPGIRWYHEGTSGLQKIPAEGYLLCRGLIAMY